MKEGDETSLNEEPPATNKSLNTEVSIPIKINRLNLDSKLLSRPSSLTLQF